MSKDTYEYRLTYINGDSEVTHIFPADINGPTLHNNLRQFLLGCSWSEPAIDEIIGEYQDE